MTRSWGEFPPAKNWLEAFASKLFLATKKHKKHKKHKKALLISELFVPELIDVKDSITPA
jgi:hypothetical protein